MGFLSTTIILFAAVTTRLHEANTSEHRALEHGNVELNTAELASWDKDREEHWIIYNEILRAEDFTLD